MSCALENVDACLPITAIQVLKVSGRELLLSGHGPCLVVNDNATGRLLQRCQIFQRNNIHGIKILGFASAQPGCTYKIFAWGGQSLRLLDLKIAEHALEKSILLTTSSLEFTCPDWILDADFYTSTEDVPGSPMHTGCLITAHNVIFGLCWKDNSNQAGSIFRLYEIASELKPILYSADIAWISPALILVASGTVFGEIIVWECHIRTHSAEHKFSDYSIRISRYFSGHQGSIFGVNISKEVHIPGETLARRYLASCSDDRTIRVWDISTCCSSQYEGRNDPFRSRTSNSTGFGLSADDIPNQEACIAKGMGHASRIWGVYFLDICLLQATLVYNILSRGEDGTCQLWKFELQPEKMETALPVTIDHISTHTYHTGKNIWAIAIDDDDAEVFKVYSGGADGRLVSFTLDRNGACLQILGELSGGYSADEVVSQLGLKHKCFEGSAQKEGRFAHYAFVSDVSFIAITLQGKLLLGSLLPVPRSKKEMMVSWSMVTTLEGAAAQYVISGNPKEQVGIIGAPNGMIWLYYLPTNSIRNVLQTESKPSGIYAMDVPSYVPSAPGASYTSFVTTFVNSSTAIFFTLRTDPDPELLSEITVNLPPSFLVTAALYIRATSWLVLGSRHGDIAIYHMSPLLESGLANCTFLASSLHGNDAITSIIALGQPTGQHDHSHVVTTGRDGYYQLHSIHSRDSASKLITLRTLHKASPPFGPNVEGATLDNETNDLILYGFKGIYFIVWNESAQTELMAANCGGCHRVWTYKTDYGGRKTCVWTKASRLHMFSSANSSHRVVLAGGHGREIKSASIMSLPPGPQGILSIVFATGAEDTTIRLFLPQARSDIFSNGMFRCQKALKKHTAGIQHLQWSPCGKFLFSSSGCEEMFVWGIQVVPNFGISALLLGECPKSKPVSDLRITHFDILKPGNEDVFLLALVYSNSTIAVLYCDPNFEDGFFKLIAQGQYSTNCLTHVRFVISGRQSFLITTSTDGHIALWNLSGLADLIFNANGKSSVHQSKYKFPMVPVELKYGKRYAVHRSSIKALEMLQISETDFLAFCGGDDNALSVSRLDFSGSESGEQGESYSFILLPQAHASAINAIAVIGDIRHLDDGYDVTIATSGNDQRLKIWSIHVCEPKDRAITLTPKRDLYTAVADISSMEVFTANGNGQIQQYLVACGVGMDIWRVNDC
ncbi:WD repeat-containing protein 6 [Ophidiomyces ophidiicola]|nr:WD repeat-containing protein 6 [Ophidiomyces ophidiicola]KAI1918801.1 WD repeat-containing protein 6 [Ophidiomyces ophidiicola]KAI1926234.1 WD repeat-containing protein 6 [Ophidiomyces ophidiicola]KAI1956944.1 WD repeat-containing protein 6 [Ophidiomyces ophidiicola]KAI1991467.1 WD repeat-containing protein 6 [Ophidiomyces ophidiicola]